MRGARSIVDWLETRLGLREPLSGALRHPIPLGTASWWYVFGSATLVCFGVLLVTGVALSLFYVPSAAEAWSSLEQLNHDVTAGWLLRAIHYWASNFMVGLLLIHMLQVFLFGAYKFPRELTWVVGVLLLACTLANAFTGQIMRFDEDAYWGIGIGVAITGRVPFIGAQLVDLLLGGPIIGGRTLSRFFTLHVFVVPGLLLALVAVHLRLVLRLGINEPPVPGRPVRRATYREQYDAMLAREGVPFFPNAAWRDLIFAGLVLLAILGCALIFGPKGPTGLPDPTHIHVAPRPDFWFLSLFALLALLPPWMETFLILTAPAIVLGCLLAIPFIAGTGEKSPRRRPAAVVGVILVGSALALLTRYGQTAPWSPRMSAWSGTPTPVAYVRGRSPLELQGAILIQQKQCRNCHSLGGAGGERGPALDGVATRMTKDRLVRQLLDGGGNMPAYGKRLSPPEVDALVAFLRTLHPPQRAPARAPAP